MPRGGFRPGAGRKPKVSAAPVAPAPKRKQTTKPDEPQAPSELMPLEYLLEIMRDRGEDKARRMQAANLAAPYCHTKKGEGGKKDERANAAKKAAGKFAASAPPRLVVNNK